MNDCAKQELILGLLTMAKVLRQPPDLAEAGADGTSIVVEIYAVALAGVTGEEVRAAAARALRSSTFFPTPAELLDHVREYRRAARALTEGRGATLRALPPGQVSPVPQELRALIEETTKRLGPPPSVQKAWPSRPLTAPADPEERARLRARQRESLVRLDEWKREKGLG